MLLATLAYLAHPFMFALMVAVAGILWLGHALGDSPPLRQLGFQLVQAAILMLPGLAGLGYFLLTKESTAFNIPAWETSWENLQKVHSFKAFTGKWGAWTRIAVKTAVALLVFIVLANAAGSRWVASKLSPWLKVGFTGARERVWGLSMLGASAFLLVLFFLLPTKFAGGGYINQRLLMLAQFAGLIALCSLSMPRWLQLGAGTMLATGWLLMGVGYCQFVKQHNDGLEYIAAVGQALPKHSEVLPVSFEPAKIQKHKLNYLAARQPLMLYENYEAYVGTFPTIWRKDSWTYRFMKTQGAQLGLEDRPPWLPIDFLRQSTRKPRFIVTWQEPEGLHPNAKTKRMLQWIRLHYRLVPAWSGAPGLRVYEYAGKGE
jgi:hypothetical protein